MKKIFKRTSAIAVSAFMLSQMVPYAVFADPADNNNSLTIYPYMVPEETYNGLRSPQDDPTGTTADATRADINGDLYSGSNPMTFSVVKVDETGKPIETNGYSGTATQGTALTGLENGHYKITPNNPTTDSGTGRNFKDAEAFFIDLPSSATGTNNYDVHVYPKLTDNDEAGDTKDPSVPDTENPNYNPENPITANKHAIKLTKSLSDVDNWAEKQWENGDITEATFDIFYTDSLGNWIDAGDFTTTNGVLMVDGLALGKYYAVEKIAPTGYLLDKTPIEFNLDGSGTISQQVQTMSNDSELKVKKNVVTEGEGTGLHYKWKIEAEIPDKAQNLISYSVTDTYTNQKNVTIASVVATDGSERKTLGSGDYTTSTDTGTLTVTLTAAGIAKLGDYSSLEITVTSDIADNYESGKVINASSINYEYAYNPPADDPNNHDDDINQIIPDPDDPNDPDRPYTPDPKAYPGNGTDEDTTDEFVPATITISNVDAADGTTELSDGEYEIDRCSPHSDADDGDGDTTITTLENLAPGVYTIEQTATQSGYFVDDPVNPKTIFVDKDGTVYEGTAAVEGKELRGNKVIFKNSKTALGFELPFTGTIATRVFTIVGICLMGGALFFIIILFKKRDEDEEEQNKA